MTDSDEGNIARFLEEYEGIASRTDDPLQRSQIYHQCGLILQTDGSAEKALDFFLKASRDDSGSLPILKSIRECSRRLKKWGTLVEYAEKEVSLSDGELKKRVIAETVEILESGGEIRHGYEFLKKYKEDQRSSGEFQKIFLRLAKKNDGEKRWAELAEEFIRDGHYNPGVYYDIASFYYFTGETAKAIPVLRRILEKDDKNLPVLKLLIDACIHLGDFDSLQDLFGMPALDGNFKMPLLFYSAFQFWYKGEQAKALKLIEEYLKTTDSITAIELRRIMDDNFTVSMELLQQLALRINDKFFIKYLAYSTIRTLSDSPENKDIFSFFQRLLDIDQEDVVALRQLEKYIDIETQPEGVIHTLEAESKMLKDRWLLTGLIIMLAQIYIDSGQIQQARDVLATARALDPQNFEVMKLQEKTLLLMQDWHGLIDVFEAEAGVVQDPKEVLYIYFRIGELFEMNLVDDINAGSYYEKVLALSPNYLPALRAIRRIYTRQEKWHDLLDIIRREIEITSDGSVLLELMLERARILERFLNDAESAQNVYSEALDSFPGNTIAIGALKRIYRKAGKWDKLRDIMLKEVGYITEPVIRADIWHEIGCLLEKESGDNDEALNCYYQCLKEYGGYTPAYSAIESLLRNSGRDAALKDFYNSMLNRISDNEAKISILLKLSQIYSENQDELQKIYDSALELSPHNPLLLDILEHFFEKRGNYSRMLDILDRKMKIASDEKTRALHLIKKALIQEKRFGDIDAAIDSFEKAVAGAPNLYDGWENLIRIYENKDNYTDLAGVLKRYADIVDSSEKKKELFLMLANISYTTLNDSQSAINCYKEIIKQGNADTDTLKRLCEILEGTGRFNEAADVQFKIVESLTDKSEVVTELKGLSQLLEKTGKKDEAVVHLKKAFEISKNDIGLLLDLERLLHDLGEWQELYNIYKHHLTLKISGVPKLRIHKDAGKIAWDRLNNPEDAIINLNEALKIDNKDIESLRILDLVYTSAGNKEKISEILENLSEIITDADEKSAALKRLGKIYAEAQKYQDGIRIFETLKRIKPEDLEGLYALDSLYSNAGKWDKAYEVDGEILNFISKREEIAEINYKMGCAQEQLGNSKTAMEHFNRALGNLPGHIASLKAKIRILREKKNYPLLSKSLIEIAKYLQDMEEKSIILMEAGNVLLEKLKLEEESLSTFTEAFSANKDNYDAAIILTKIYSGRKNWEKALKYSRDSYDIVNKKVEGREKAEFLFRMAFALEQLKEEDEAFQVYGLASAIVEDYVAPILGSARLFLKREKWSSATELLLKVKSLVENTADKDALFYALYNLGVASYQVEDLPRSIEYLESAKRIKMLDPDILEELAGVYELMRNWQKCAQNLEEWLILGIMEKRELMLLRLGKLYSESLNKPERAMECFRDAVKVKPDFTKGYEALIDFLVLMEKWEEAVSSIQDLLKYETEKKLRTALLLKESTLLYEKLNKPAKAVEIAKQITEDTDAKLDGYHLLARIYSHQNDWQSAIGVYSKIFDLGSPKEKKISLMERGKILKDKLRNPKAAIDDFRGVLKYEPANLDARLALAEIFEKDGTTMKEAIREYQAIINNDYGRLETFRSLGRIYEGLREYDRAYCIYTILNVFGAANDLEKVFLNSIAPKTVKKPLVPVTDEIKEKFIIHQNENNIMREFFKAVGGDLDGLYPADLDKYGVTKKDLLPKNSPANIVIAANDAAQILNVADFRIYSASRIQHAVVENTSPPSIIIPAALVDSIKLGDARFFMGIHLAHIIDCHNLPLKIGAGEVKKIIQLLLKALHPETKVDGLNEEDASQRAKKVYKTLSRKTKHVVEGLLEKSGNDLLNLNPDDYLTGIKHTALRVALLLVNDISIALRIVPLLGIEPDIAHGTENKLNVFQNSKFLKDLLIYTISDRYFSARQQLKLSLLS